MYQTEIGKAAEQIQGAASAALNFMRPNTPADAYRFTNKEGPFSDTCGSPCWLWMGCKNRPPLIPYGRFRLDGQTTYAHIVIYEMEIGPVPEDKLLSFDCRRSDCVNPFHKTPMSKTEVIRHGDSPYGKKFRQTACVHGHPLTGANLVHRENGNRGCRECTRKSRRDSMRRHRSKFRKQASDGQRKTR